MRLLDLFSGAGGAAVGYHRAGFEDITGVDIKPMPKYPFEFVQGDALEYVIEHGHEYDLIHASPPCQAYSIATILRGISHRYPDMVAETRDGLQGTGKPYIIENVRMSPLKASLMLCGTMFGLRVLRHRYFEIAPILAVLTPPCQHNGTVRGGDYVTVAGHGADSTAGNCTIAAWREAMGIDWMNRKEIVEAIPPAYTEFIGRRIMEVLDETV